jgi:hypothetical protein
MNGPAWLGIGAQRSGTTWFTDLLCQHPKVELGVNGRKEQHALPGIAEGRFEPAWYVELFTGQLAGEFTPRYMRCLSTPKIAAALCREDAPIIVLLRDPVERFISAMRRYEGRKRSKWPYEAVFIDAQWTGMYADQLEVWAEKISRDRFIVMQYEILREDPQHAVDIVWQRLGIDPVPLEDIDSPSTSSSKVTWQPPPGMTEALVTLYRPQVDRLTREWNIDPTKWPNFRE